MPTGKHLRHIDVTTGAVTGFTIAAVPSKKKGRVADIVVASHEMPWSAEMALVLREGRPVLDDVVFHCPGPAGLTTDALRDFPVALVLDTARRQLVTMGDHAGLSPVADPATEEFRRRARRAAKSVGGGPHRGRIGYGEAHYRALALDYLELQDAHGHRGLRERLAQQYDVSPETMRDWIRRARELQFLSKATPGRGGSDAGPRLHEETTR